jgi:glutaredoxin 3
MYTTDFCSKCIGAKALLTKRGIEFTEHNLARDPDSRATIQRITGRFTFPQILIGETPIGGLDELSALDRSGRLSELLAEAA